VGLFEEARCTAVVAKQLIQEHDRRVRKALLPVDLEVHGKCFQKAKRKLI
jgi:hypothetical protein